MLGTSIAINRELCRVRTITAFITLTPNKSEWKEVLIDAKKQCYNLVQAIQSKGYLVQTVRFVTNPFAEYINTATIETAKQDLDELTQLLSNINSDSKLRIRFAIGEARTFHEIELLPELIKSFGDLCNVCVNVPQNEYGLLENDLIRHSALAIQEISKLTDNGQGNFNFTVNFNCQSYIPYFPAGYHRNEQGNVIVLGLETPDLLLAALKSLTDKQSVYFMSRAKTAMQQSLQYHVDEILSALDQCQLDDTWKVIGLDSSAAPSKNCASMVDIYQELGVPYFGAAGTIEASALLTSVFKSIKNIPLVGFSGLMLAVTEDTGLAEGSKQGNFDIQALLTYSSVCGIGLDTVAIAGDTPIDRICSIMRDTGTMAYRLNKPLTVRLFPIPNAKAGELSQFVGDDLCNAAALQIP